ncbi:hypothetical protein [Pseudomonas amygdali]|nr:hypothetical protein [Pseudomonas amygdali]
MFTDRPINRRLWYQVLPALLFLVDMVSVYVRLDYRTCGAKNLA